MISNYKVNPFLLYRTDSIEDLEKFYLRSSFFSDSIAGYRASSIPDFVITGTFPETVSLF
jgi:hypothetical protein